MYKFSIPWNILSFVKTAKQQNVEIAAKSNDLLFISFHSTDEALKFLPSSFNADYFENRFSDFTETFGIFDFNKDESDPTCCVLVILYPDAGIRTALYADRSVVNGPMKVVLSYEERMKETMNETMNEGKKPAKTKLVNESLDEFRKSSI